MAAVAALDKTLSSFVSDGYGTMTVRVVVLTKPGDQVAPTDDPAIPLDLDEDETISATGKTPVSGYVEDPKRGKECCVFIINGQRQDAWDNTFIVRDLNKKYLRNRMLIMVDLDGLKPEAMGALMSGDRQGFFQGKEYGAISARLISTLKKDPDLERLEEDAEREIAELRTGDEAVKQALDQLIEEHHSEADRQQPGSEQADAQGKAANLGFGRNEQRLVVVEPHMQGLATSGPYLFGQPSSPVIRLHPSESTALTIFARPLDTWERVGPLHVEVVPNVLGLKFKTEPKQVGAKISLIFEEPSDWEDDQYPLEASLRITGRIKGYEEPRLLERRIVISKPKKRQRQPFVLLDEPTLIRVTSRQPISLRPGGGDAHVRLAWDGKDELTAGSEATWSFAASCLSVSSFPPITFSKPSGGRFELLLQVPEHLNASAELLFKVEARGPNNRVLSTNFTALVVAPVKPEPKKIKQVVPEPAGQRKPPYVLAYVRLEEWAKGNCWNERRWTAQDAGCFHDPTDSTPLTLVINEDMELLATYREGLTAKKLEASTVKERVTRYCSHVAFHLYQLYLNYRDLQEEKRKDDSVQVLSPEQMAAEVNRVAATVVKVMQVSR